MSAGKRTIKPVVLVSGASLSSSYTSAPFSIERYDRAVLEIIAAGSMVGVMTVEMSNDYISTAQLNGTLNPKIFPANWVTIPLGLSPVAGIDMGFMVDFTETGIPWLRVSYASTSGSGSLTVVMTAKES